MPAYTIHLQRSKILKFYSYFCHAVQTFGLNFQNPP